MFGYANKSDVIELSRSFQKFLSACMNHQNLMKFVATLKLYISTAASSLISFWNNFNQERTNSKK